MSQVNTFLLSHYRDWRKLKNVYDFRKSIQFIRAYHGCRPLCISIYKKHGLLLPSKERLSAMLYELIGEHVERNKLNELINQRWDEYAEKGIYFALDKNTLLDQCGHYMIYGSEFVSSIANYFHCRAMLKQCGTPTIFTVNVPTKFISDCVIQELIEMIKKDFYEDEFVDFAFKITQPLSYQYVVKTEHPNAVKDPFC